MLILSIKILGGIVRKRRDSKRRVKSRRIKIRRLNKNTRYGIIRIQINSGCVF